MQEEIVINHCSLCRPIDRDETKYHTDIIATNCIWRENLEGNSSLIISPVAGRSYFLTLKPPVRFQLNMDVWLYFDNPVVALNGYSTEQEVEQSKFCFGKIVSIIGHDESGATVEVRIQNTLTFQEVLIERPAKELPAFWTDFFIASLNNHDYSLIEFGKYLELSVSIAQGDIGLSCIITKFNQEYFICKMFHWNFHEEYWFGGKYRLPDFLIKKIVD